MSSLHIRSRNVSCGKRRTTCFRSPPAGTPCAAEPKQDEPGMIDIARRDEAQPLHGRCVRRLQSAAAIGVFICLARHADLHVTVIVAQGRDEPPGVTRGRSRKEDKGAGHDDCARGLGRGYFPSAFSQESCPQLLVILNDPLLQEKLIPGTVRVMACGAFSGNTLVRGPRAYLIPAVAVQAKLF